MALTFKQALQHFWQQISLQFVHKETGKGLSTNDYTTADKNKVSSLPSTIGTITGVTAGSGLTGGGKTGSVTLNVAADRGLDITNNKIGHTNSITAGTSSEGGSARTLGFGGTFKVPSITYDAQGHIKSVGTTTLTMPANPDTDTHHTANLVVGASSSAKANAAASDGSVYVNLVENNEVRNSHLIDGTGTVTVTSDANGKITINGSAHPTVNNATISIAAGAGLTGSGDFTTNQSSAETITLGHSNSVTAGTAQGSATKTLTFGDTFTIPTVTYDAQGHITNKGTTTMTMPANPIVDAGATDEEIIDVMLNLDMLPTILDADGSILIDNDESIVLF